MWFSEHNAARRKNSNLLTAERDNKKYGISLECEVGSAAEKKMHIVFFDCMKTLCDIQDDISSEKYEAGLSMGGKYYIKRLDTIASVSGFEAVPFVNVSVYGWSNYYTLKVVREPVNGEIGI